MNKDLALNVAGVVFGLVAIMHLVRLFLKWKVVIAGLIIPFWASVVACIIALILSLWMLRAAQGSEDGRRKTESRRKI